MRLIFVSILGGLLLAAAARAQPDLASGEKTYQVCAGCHGFVGEGDELVNAPRLAGLASWYLTRQIRNFENGLRGNAEGDDHGRTMAVMAKAAKGDRTLGDLVGYIQSLPVSSSPDSVAAGDAGRGQGLYSVCAACHGADGLGNEALSAPGLVNLDDWYLVRQLELFAEGLRGTSGSDTYGQQMRALAGSFKDEQSRLDLAVYIRTLRN